MAEESWPHVDMTPLDEDDLPETIKKLTDVAASWRNIGIQLGIRDSQLEAIQLQGESPLNCLRQMLSTWLRKNYNVKKFEEPTWMKLIEAVNHPAGGGNPSLAMKIAKNHEVPLISNSTKSQQTSPSQQKEAEAQMMPQMLVVTETQQTPSSPQGEAEMQMTRQKLSKAAGFTRENRQAIQAKFADFQTKVCNKLSDSGVNTKKFRLFVINQFPPGDCIPPSPTSVTEIFEAITHNRLWDYFHYSPLVHIVQAFGANDRDMECWVQTYKQDLKAYQLVTTVEDYIDITDTTLANRARCDPRYYTPVEWKTNFIDHSLQYLAEVCELFSSHYLMPDSPPTALLERVRRGCFTVTWLIPSGLILSLVKSIKIDYNFLQQHHILRVTVGEKKCVYEAKESQLQLTASEQVYAQLQQNLQEKEKMIQELKKENQQLRHELDKVSQQPIQEEKLSFEMCDSPAPRPMHRGSATVCGNMAYFRLGFTESEEVLSYNSDTNVWSTLPVCPRDRFTLTVINDLVTAVGGRQSNKYTNTLLSLMEEGAQVY